jgi:agmatine/peptidylarginine deiminase
MLPAERVTVVNLPQDDSWFRDTGPVVSPGTSAWHSRAHVTCNSEPGRMRSVGRNHSSIKVIHGVQFVVRRGQGGQNVAICGNDFVFNSWGHKNVTWDVDDEIADWVRCVPHGLSL